MTEQLSLASDFPAATAGEWEKLVLGVLRKSGAATDDTTPAEAVALLTTTGYDGVPLEPLYTAAGAPTRSGTLGRTANEWDIRQRHADPDPAATAEAARADLENGVTSLWLVVGERGVPVDGLAAALDGVYLDLAGVTLDAGAEAPAAAAAFLAVAQARGCAPSGNFGFDPLSGAGDTESTVSVARSFAQNPGMRTMVVDATRYHDAGASDTEELACSIATGVAYLRLLTDAGLSVAEALGQLEFRYAATADQFGTIAKLRAARALWARVARACASVASLGDKSIVSADADAVQRQHAVTSAAMMTARDPWVNMLRTTLACFAAGVGGADAVTVLPFDHRLGLPDAFARRIARNTQSLLAAEASVGRVTDPAGGSWYVESRTDGLARAAWAWFTEIEGAGGMEAALSSGLVSDRIESTWRARAENLAHRRDPLIGVSEFPNLYEKLPERRPAAPTTGHHYGEAFESLRDRSDALPERPTVYLATLGPPAAHNARVGFATNLFAAGGIAVKTGPVDGFAASGLSVACVCGSDRSYAEEASGAALTLASGGARQVWLAGRPGGYDGVTGYLYNGCDAVAVLTEVLS
jgi:methylmalonyl-CoA mutase